MKTDHSKLNSEIIGSWDLVSFEIQDNGGNKTPWGKQTEGQLIYTNQGRMSVSINKEIEPNSDQPTDSENPQDILDSILFYAGTYRVSGQTIHHSVTLASDPDRRGKTMEREVQFEQDEAGDPILVLVSPFQSFGRSILKWKKSNS